MIEQLFVHMLTSGIGVEQGENKIFLEGLNFYWEEKGGSLPVVNY